jgi:hypothetical protein
MPSALRAGCCCLMPFLAAACATAPARVPAHPAGGAFTLFVDDSAAESPGASA